MRKIIALVDEDLEYVKRLAEYFNDKDSGLKSVAFASADFTKQERAMYEPAILVTFSDTRVTQYGNKNVCMYKYQNAEKIYRDVMRAYADREETPLVSVVTQDAHFSIVYSPINRSGKTTFAVTLALAYSKLRKTLFVTLDEYGGVFRYIAAQAMADLSDVIYAFRQGECSWARIEATVCEFGTLRYIPPVRYAEDILAVTPEEMCEVLRCIAREGNFEEVVIDAGAYGKRVIDLLEMCDDVIVPTRSSEVSQCKMEEFYEALEASGHGELKNRIKLARLPYDKRYATLMIKPSDYSWGDLWEYARALQNAR